MGNEFSYLLPITLSFIDYSKGQVDPDHELYLAVSVPTAIAHHTRGSVDFEMPSYTFEHNKIHSLEDRVTHSVL